MGWKNILIKISSKFLRIRISYKRFFCDRIKMMSVFRSVRLMQQQSVRRMSGTIPPGLTGDAMKQAWKDKADHAGQVAAMWTKITIFGGVPVVLGIMYNAYLIGVEHHNHLEEHGLPEFKKASYMYIRNVQFPWGDGNHSLFHTSNNALPEGYEEKEE